MFSLKHIKIFFLYIFYFDINVSKPSKNTKNINLNFFFVKCVSETCLGIEVIALSNTHRVYNNTHKGILMCERSIIKSKNLIIRINKQLFFLKNCRIILEKILFQSSFTKCF